VDDDQVGSGDRLFNRANCRLHKEIDTKPTSRHIHRGRHRHIKNSDRVMER
jgi:hypothetical protein